MTAETTSTSLAETIRTENIPDFVQSYRYAPNIMAAVAWVENIGPGSGAVHRWPRFNVITPNSGTKTESTGAFANFEADAAEESATSGVVGVALDISREAAYDSRAGLPASVIAEGLAAMQSRLEGDALAVCTGAVSTVGVDTDIMTLQHVGSGFAAFELTIPQAGETAIVLAPSQWTDLCESLRSTGSPGIVKVDLAGDMFAATPGYRGMLLGARLFVTPNVVVEGGGRNAVITTMGYQKSGLGIAVWQRIEAELDPAPLRYADVWVLTSRYGVSLTNNHATRPNLTELRSDGV